MIKITDEECKELFAYRDLCYRTGEVEPFAVRQILDRLDSEREEGCGIFNKVRTSCYLEGTVSILEDRVSCLEAKGEKIKPEHEEKQGLGPDWLSSERDCASKDCCKSWITGIQANISTFLKGRIKHWCTRETTEWAKIARIEEIKRIHKALCGEVGDEN